jgi:HEAT repeat protein
MNLKSIPGRRTAAPLVYFTILCCAPVAAQSNVDKAWGVLNKGLAEHSAEHRAKAVHALGLIPENSKAQEFAEKALGDEAAPVRAAGAGALGAMNAKGAIPKLKAAVKDTDAQVVFASAASLYQMNDHSAYEVYYAVLSGEKKSGEGLVDSQMKMLKDPKAMAKLGFEQGLGFIPFAGAGYSVFKAVSKDDTSPIRAAAAQRLVRDPDPRSAKALAAAATDKKWLVRAAAVDAIAKREDPALLPAVLPLLADEDETVRYNAAAAVIHLSVRSTRSR